MARVYKSVCNEIDVLSIQLINLSESNINLKLQIEKIMDDGFGDLAKARYIMGSKCVSTLQLPTQDSNPMTALSVVTHEIHNKHPVFKLQHKTQCTGAGKATVKSVNKKDEDNVKDSEGVRNRKGIQVIEDEDFKNVQETLDEEMENEVAADATLVDPIRLFGVLVPQALRLSQKSFTRALYLLVDCATIQSELQTSLNRFNHLLQVKKLMEVSTIDRQVNVYDDSQFWTPTVSKCSLLESREGVDSKSAEETSYSYHEIQGSYKNETDSCSHLSEDVETSSVTDNIHHLTLK